jgi:hypothetical protein
MARGKRVQKGKRAEIRGQGQRSGSREQREEGREQRVEGVKSM